MRQSLGTAPSRSTDVVRKGDTDGGLVVAFPLGSAPGSQVWATANNARYCRVITGGTISKIGLHITVASGNISVAAYAGAGGGLAQVPTTQLATSGSIACPAVGYREISLGATITVYPGDFLALSADNITFAMAGNSGQDATPLVAGQLLKQSSAHPLPATPSGITATGFRVPALIGVP